jgi:hypothetical protein
MITHTKQVQERRDDESLSYECTMAFLSKDTEHLYDRRVQGEDGCFIRINHATKYKPDGSIQWRLIYNSKGEVIGTEKGSHYTQDPKQMELL